MAKAPEIPEKEKEKNSTKLAGNIKYLVVIAGPTAIGKTALAIDLAKHYNSVIISADSRQFYKELTIGTAKPSEKELQEVPHYFINNKSIEELYGAGHFEKDATDLLNELFTKHSIVILVGGSGLYINALLYGVDEFEEVPINYREELNKELEVKGIAHLQEELKRTDPVYFKQVDLNNSQRIIRALEVIRYTGKPFSFFKGKHKKTKDFVPIKILLNCNRQALYDKINKRVDEMIKSGLIEEVKELLPYKQNNALKTVGYKELFEYLDGKCSLETAIDKIKQHTRNYAKRQLTWFKNQDEYEEFSPEDRNKIIGYIDVVTKGF